MSERELRELMASLGRSLHERGLAPGSSGNLSVRLPDGMLITPTNSCLGRLNPDEITRLDESGNVRSGRPPSKEVFLHQAYYRSRPAELAVVHLHSTWAVALSCLASAPMDSVLSPITAYSIMRVGRLPLIPYFPPGDRSLANAVGQAVESTRGVLLANHGLVIGGTDLETAVFAAEELEETAKLSLLLRDRETRFLTDDQVSDLAQRFAS